MQLAKIMKESNIGDTIEIIATDPGFTNDAKAWCESTGNELLKLTTDKGKIRATIQKGKSIAQPACTAGTDKTMVVFSNDLDKAIATFIIANGATSMGRKVTLFFTFWGLNILRKPEGAKVKKGLLDIMFGLMMPRGSTKLLLSKMNMGGMGGQMIRWVMKNKNIDSLESLIAQAQASGVRMVACQMSMDVMGIKKEELIDGVEIGGVAQYLNAAEKSDTNLFI
jgi:peroxiredoxin family protein/TusA-related sulfurtransferase